MTRLYADENFPYPVAIELRRLGHNILTIQEAGKAGQEMPDEAVLTDATGDNRAVLTHNRKHFIHLHSSHPTHAGIIVCTIDLNFESLAGRIHEAIESQGHLSGQLIRVNRLQR